MLALQETLVAGELVVRHAELVEILHQSSGVEDPDDHLLAESDRQCRDAELDLAAARVGLDSAVLGSSSLGDVHAAEHLDA